MLDPQHMKRDGATAAPLRRAGVGAHSPSGSGRAARGSRVRPGRPSRWAGPRLCPSTFSATAGPTSLTLTVLSLPPTLLLWDVAEGGLVVLIIGSCLTNRLDTAGSVQTDAGQGTSAVRMWPAFPGREVKVI